MNLPAGFVDIHTHIIPNLDDGPPDLETAVALVRAAGEGGTRLMVATSHSEEVIRDGGGRDAMLERLAAVRRAIAAAGLDMTLLLGTEIYLEPDSAQRLRRGEVFPINDSRYVLVELPFQALPIYLDQALFELQTAGYVPIIAHPERNGPVQQDARPLYDWVARGALLQISAASLAGGFGRAAARTARFALAHRLCHAVASDAHDPINRSPRLGPAFAMVRDEYGLDTAQAVFIAQPRAIVEDRPLSAPDPLPVAPNDDGGVFRRLFGRR